MGPREKEERSREEGQELGRMERFLQVYLGEH